jgi:beta-galactosidase/beta-glucuronidase
MPRPEYPRPDFQRKTWMNLNGEWDFAYDPGGVGEKEKWFNRTSLPDKIIVPFPVESDASGKSRAHPPRFLWYLKRFTMPPKMKGRPALLHFGAVDYHARCWINGHFAGEHRGGYTPFSFDITSFLNEGENVLVVKAEDSRSMFQVRGKQSFLKKDFMIFYRPVSGIWQTVWLESVGSTYLEEVLLLPDYRKESMVFKIRLNRDTGARILIRVVDPEGGRSASVETELEGVQSSLSIALKKIFPWSPDKPDLYRVYYTLKGPDGAVSDQVESYFGWREISIKGDRIFLNGRPLYQKLLLNQGYYPGGHYTATDDQVLRRDVEMVKEMGYNGIRIHQKIEDKRLLYWCDTLGLLTWAEMPSFYLPSRASRKGLFEEWKQFMRRDFNHPCIIAWVPFNETWGVMDLFWKKSTRLFIKKVVAFTRNFDRTRPVIDNSGFDHVDSDIVDIHLYPLVAPSAKRFQQMFKRYRSGKNMEYGLLGHLYNLLFPWIPIVKRPLAPGARYSGQPIMISEYGGFGFYRSKKGKGLEENLRDYTRAIMEEDWVCGYCYTQQYDTYQERNGLITFERNYKLSPEITRNINLPR